jgi:hypothetical protein
MSEDNVNDLINDVFSDGGEGMDGGDCEAHRTEYQNDCNAE